MLAAEQHPAIYAIYAYPGFWRRLLALTVDTFALFVLSNILATLGVFAVVPAQWRGRWGFPTLQALGLAIGPGVLISWIYFSFFTAVWGFTPGKLALGLRVIDIHGRRPPLTQVLQREVLGRLLSELTLFIGYIMVGLTRENRGLHDLIGGTWVVTTLGAIDVEGQFRFIEHTLATRGEMPPDQLTSVHQSGRVALLEEYARVHSEEAVVCNGVLCRTGAVELI